MAGGSDVDALEGGFRARAVLLVLVVLGGLAAAVWSGTREVGEGEPESRRRLMVVTRGAGIDYYAVLERAGFEIEVESYERWLDIAGQAVPDSESSGVELLLERADHEGVGYLVLERPRDFGLDELHPDLDIEPRPSTIEELHARDYAVLSVGDLAFPHHLSVAAVDEDALVRLPGFGALEAVFAQPSLLAREDQDRPTVEELQHEDAIERGQWMVGRRADFAATIAEADEAIATQLAADPDARLLAPAGSAGSALPLPNGGVLVVHHSLEVYSRDATKLELHPGSTMRFDYLDREGLAGLLEGQPLTLEPCTSLAGGELELDQRPQVEAAVDGSALVVSTSSDGTELWQLEPGPGCRFRSHGPVDGLGEGRLVVAPAQASPGAALVLAEVGVNFDGSPNLRAWSSTEASLDDTSALGHGESEDQPSFTRVELLHLSEGQLGAAAFIDPNHLALLSSTPLPAELAATTRMREDAVHILDRRAPGAHLRMPTTFFAEGMALHELAVLEPPRVEPGQGPRLVLLASRTGGPTELLVVEISAEAWAEFDPPLAADGDAELRQLYTLTPEDLETLRIEGERGRVRFGLSVSDGVMALAEAEASDPSEVGWLRLDADVESTPRFQQLTSNALIDRLARVGAEGRLVVFSTLIRSSLSARSYSVPRVIALP